MFKRANQIKTLQRGRRAKRYRLPLSAGSDLQVTFRWFITNKVKRSQKLQQRVFRTPGLPFKEVSLVRIRHRRKQYTKILGFRIGSAALITLGFGGGLFSSQYLITSVNLQPVSVQGVALKKVSNLTTLQPLPLPRSVPTSLQIDSVSITAPIVSTGLRSDQSIEVPGPKDVGWYDQGPTPGEKGPAVLVGHVDYLHDIAVFWRLRYLRPGDIMKVSRQDGTVVSFRVDSIQQYDQDNFPTQAVYGALDYAGIRVITCGGTFNHTTHHYSQNTVVFGTMVDSANS